MQVPASSYPNFTSQMTGEIWVRPDDGGPTTSGADNLKVYLNGQLIAAAAATGNLATGDGMSITGGVE